MTLLVASLLCSYQPLAPVVKPRLAPRALLAMAAEPGDSGAVRKVGVELMAQRGRGAVGSLTREDGQQYVGVPPPGSSSVQGPSLLQRARAPFLGVTFMATAVVAGWKSNQMYKVRQQGLLDQFGLTMLYHLGDERETAVTIKNFRQQLGPGSYRGAMFVSYMKQLAIDAPLEVKTILELKRVVAQMQLSQSIVGELLIEAMGALQKQPSVLGKLVFIAERALPAAAGTAQLRTKFPTWSEETVSTLQRAMLENLYRDLCEQPGYDTAETLSVLGLTAAEAARLKQEVEDNKLAAAEAAEAEEAERLRAEQLKEAIRKASEVSAPAAGTHDADATDADAHDGERATGTHEYECTKCGYVMFPAAGREFKFYGDDFKCPNCGADKDAFVDNGVVEV